MTPRELAEGQHRVRRAFCRWGSILKRLRRHWKGPTFYLALNLAMRFAAKRAQVPLAPGGDEHGAFVAAVDTRADP